MEHKSDIDSSLCEGGLSRNLSVRKGRSTSRKSIRSSSVRGQTTVTTLSDKAKISNPEMLIGCDGFSAKLRNIKAKEYIYPVKEEYVSSEEEDVYPVKGEYVSSEEEYKYPVKEENVSSEEEDTTEEEKTSSAHREGSFREKKVTSLRAGNTSSRKKAQRNTKSDIVQNVTNTQQKQGQQELKYVRRQEISEDLRRQVVEAHKNGKGYKKISKDLDLHLSTVRKIIYKWKKFNTVVTLPRSGRPTKISAKVHQKILKHMRENTRVTIKDLKASLALDNINIHESTIKRTLRKWCSWDFTMEEATALQQE